MPLSTDVVSMVLVVVNNLRSNLECPKLRSALDVMIRPERQRRLAIARSRAVYGTNVRLPGSDVHMAL
jgi:hypothetical protein